MNPSAPEFRRIFLSSLCKNFRKRKPNSHFAALDVANLQPGIRPKA
jgi:hypothetical protein